MKTRWIYAIVMIASLGWVACDDDDLDRPSLNETDDNFVEEAALSNMAEIEFGELAKTKGTDPLITEYAEMMVTEHTTAQEELRDIATDYDNVNWPNGLQNGFDDTWETLNDLEGYSFDSAYIKSQVKIHEDASMAFESATTNATDTRVKAYATKYLPKIETHLQEANTVEASIIAENAPDVDKDETGDGTDDTGN